jgi:ferredoxin
MPSLKIDNVEVTVEPGSTILHAARKIGLDIPALCYRDGCLPNTSCLACVVKVNNAPRLLPSCATKVVDGMVVESETPEVRAARRMAMELLLADHAGDCQAPCTNVCPAHMDISSMLRHIREHDFGKAIVVVKEHIALPAVLGRICPELCEKGCRRAATDQAVSICSLKRFVADTDLASGHPYLPSRMPDSGKRVAIVGSGPAGLAAAWYLQQLGHNCTLLDDHPLPGGNLRYAVGEDLLPRDVLDEEIDLIKRQGAAFQMSTKLGKDVALDDLKRGFDAVLITVGEIDKTKAQAMGLEMLGKGLKADKSTMMTSVAGVFAAGGAVQPMKHAVRAVREGREAAHIIHQYLNGRVIVPDKAAFTVRLGVLSDQEQGIMAEHAAGDGRVSSHGQSQGLSVDEAVRQASRCLNCNCSKEDDCKLRTYAQAYEANARRYGMERRPLERVETHPSVIWEPGKCISCGLCVQIASRDKEPLGLTYIGRGFSVRVSAPFGRDMSEALQKVAQEVCEACPTAALTLKGRRPQSVAEERQKELAKA